MNENEVPRLFVASGATKWNDPRHSRGRWAGSPAIETESRIYAKYILKEMPNAKIAILYQNDDYGKDYIKGLKDGLGAMALAGERAEQIYRDDLAADKDRSSTPWARAASCCSCNSRCKFAAR